MNLLQGLFVALVLALCGAAFFSEITRRLK